MKMRRNGGICFISSCVPYIPSPYLSIYGSTKAFISQFANSLTGEASEYNVDVLSIQPGYTRTHLYDKIPQLTILKLMNLVGSNPIDVSNVITRTFGRLYSLDIGFYAHVTKIIDSFFPINVLIPLIPSSFNLLGDVAKITHKI